MNDSPSLADVQGVWRRRYLTDSVHTDDSTFVTWVQAGMWHVDVRLPRQYASIERVDALSELNASELRNIASSVGFAGTTSMVQSRCTWSRTLNYQGPLEGPDVGTLAFADHELIERGVYSEYVEAWNRIAENSSRGCCFANEAGHILVLCIVDCTFAFGRADPHALQFGAPLSRRCRAAVDRNDRQALGSMFDQEFSIGRLESGLGIIEHSCNPARVGAVAFQLPSAGVFTDVVDLNQQDFYGLNTVSRFSALV